MIRRCDDCGAEVSDTIGSRQCALFAPADQRIDPHAAEGLRTGRILCPACARGVPLEPLETPAAVAVELADGEADVKDEGVDAVNDPPVRMRKRGWQDRTSRIARTPNAEVWSPWALAWAYGVDDGRNGMHVPPADGPADRDPGEWKAYRAGVAAGIENRKNPKSGAWDSGFRAPRNKNWRGDANAEAWDRARAAGRR